MKVRAPLAAALAAAMVGISVPATAAPPSEQPIASFNWSMAERTKSIVDGTFYPQLDVSHRMMLGPDGLPGLWGGVSSVPLDEINPTGGYNVTLDACGTNAEGATYEWLIDGSVVEGATACNYSTNLTAGPHDVELAVGLNGITAVRGQTIDVKDLVIVSMGDSYSSGEGNPTRIEANHPDSSPEEIAADNGRGWSQGGYWDYAPCHRSTRSGQAQAAIDLEQADPHTSVTFLYVACSGGQVDTGILGEQHGEHPQVRQAYDLAIANGRSIDAVTLGIGGNDVGFVPIITECLMQVDCFLSTEGDLLSGKTPPVPVTSDEPVPADQLGTLLLKPTEEAPDAPGFDPSRVLLPEALHACIEQYQKALAGTGGAGCRDTIGPSPRGLVQVAQCINGSGPSDCAPLQGPAFPGLEVDPEDVFYTDYPDLTKKFINNDPAAGTEFCNISLTKEQLISLLKVAQEDAGSQEQADAIGLIITGLQLLGPANIGLTPNEFKFADLAVLRGTGPLPDVLEGLDLSGPWNVRTAAGPGGNTTIGPGRTVDFINLQQAEPALGEITRGSQEQFGWTPSLTYEGAIGHGLCAPGVDSAPREVAAYAYLLEAIGGDTNASGAAHPNMYGQALYQEALGSDLIERFAHADLSVVKTTSTATPAVPGQDVSYQIDVANQGTATVAGPITLTEELDEGLTPVSVTGEGWSCDESLTCTYAGDLAPGASASVQLVASLDPDFAGEVVNIASVLGSADAPDTFNSYALILPTESSADLSLAMQSTAAEVMQGDDVTYTLTVANAGPSGSGSPVSVTTTLPAAATFVSGAGEGWSCTAEGQKVTCVHDATLAPGATAPVITLTTALAESFSGALETSATVSGAVADPAEGNNTATATVTVKASGGTTPDPDPGTGGGGSNGGTGGTHPGNGGSTPGTGADVLMPLMVGLGALLIGGAGLLVARRRKQ